MLGHEFQTSWSDRHSHKQKCAARFCQCSADDYATDSVDLSSSACRYSRDWSTLDGKRSQRRSGRVRVGCAFISVNFKFSPILGVRNFVVGITVKVASDEATMRREKTYINKLNLALVQVCHLTLWRRVAFNAVSTDLKAGVAAQLANVHP